ncbi:MAG: EutN/CcmL family microcompartment protein [Candidatus Eisenbacteria bacterium]
MILGDVVGDMVATVKHRALEGRRLLVIRPVTPEGEPAGKTFIALDSVAAGPGDRVLVNEEGRSAGEIIGFEGAPVRSVVVGVVDEIRLEGRAAYRKSP